MARASKTPDVFLKLGLLHREMLNELLEQMGLDLSEAARAELMLAWHRLAPWPDSVPGLIRLKQRFPIVACSNENISFMVDLALNAGPPWDATLGAEIAHAYKPDAAVYRTAAAALDIKPHDLSMLAAHHSDLAGAHAAGLQCAFIHRPREYGSKPAPELAYEQDWEYRANGMAQLANILITN